MKILITGGAGFIGSHLAEYWSGEGADVIVLDNLRSGFKSNLNGIKNITFIKKDVTHFAAVRAAMRGCTYVHHCAAMVSVPESMQYPQECEYINTTGTINVLEAARQTPEIKKVIYSSSAAVYGNNPEIPKREMMAPSPESPYAVSKYAGELYFGLYKHKYDLPTVSLRYFNVFGPRQDPNSPYAAAIPIFIKRALQHEPIIIYGDGTQTRDFISVHDVVQANILAAKKGIGVYNIACGGQITIKELAGKIISMTNSRSEIVYNPERPGDIKFSRASIELIQTLGFNPAVNYDDTLQETIDYFRRRGNRLSLNS